MCGIVNLSTVALLGVLPLVHACAGNSNTYLQGDVMLHSEPITIRGALDSWRTGHYRGGDNQYGEQWLEAGIHRGRFSASIIQRQEHQTHFNRDTADYYYGTQQHQLDPNRHYGLELESRAFDAVGLHVKRDFQAPHLAWQVGVSVLQASHLQNGKLTGQAIVTDDGKDQQYQTHLQYYYYQDRVLDRPDTIAPQGIGYALDAGMQWQASPQIQMSVKARDILGELYWRNVPYTDANLTSAVKTLDSNGYVLIKPALSGTESYRHQLRTRLSPKLDANLRYQSAAKGQATVLAIKHIPEQTWWGLGREWPVHQGYFHTTFWPETRLLSFNYRQPRWSIGMAMDNPNPLQASTVWLEWQAN